MESTAVPWHRPALERRMSSKKRRKTEAAEPGPAEQAGMILDILDYAAELGLTPNLSREQIRELRAKYATEEAAPKTPAKHRPRRRRS